MSDGNEWYQRPLAAGIQISVSGFLGINVQSGTIGCFVRKKAEGISADRPVYILTAAHVLNPQLKDPGLSKPIDNLVHQPRPSGWTNAVGKVDPADLFWTAHVDAGLAQVDSGIGWSNYVWKIGPVAGVRAPMYGEIVMKCGRTTGRTYGRISSTGTWENGKFLLQISDLPDSEVPVSSSRPKGDKLNDSDHFAEEGDSGAAIIGQDQKIVGLIHARYDGGGLACNIMNVIEELGIELAV